MMRIWGKKGDTPPTGGRWDTPPGGGRWEPPPGGGGRWDTPSGARWEAPPVSLITSMIINTSKYSFNEFKLRWAYKRLPINIPMFIQISTFFLFLCK